MSKNELRKTMENLISLAEEVDAHEDSIFEDYRSGAEYSKREIIDTLLNLKSEKQDMFTFEMHVCDNLDDYDYFNDEDILVTAEVEKEKVLEKFDALIFVFEGWKYRLLNEKGESIISGAMDPGDPDYIRSYLREVGVDC